MPRTWETALVGAQVGFCAGIAQACVGQALGGPLLPRQKSADVALRLVQSTLEAEEQADPPPFQYAAAAAFHFGYAAFWGALHALTRDRLRLHPALSAGALTVAIYALAFSRASGGVLAGSEPHPRRRSRRELAFQLSVASTFTVSNALLYEWARR